MSAHRDGEDGPIVIGLGGNALLTQTDTPSMAVQWGNVRRAAAAIRTAVGNRPFVVTHGNGPQVGALAVSGEATAGLLADQTLDVANAESAGMIGYMLEQELAGRMPERQFATLLTMVVVDPDDPDLIVARKPIGSWYDTRTRPALPAGEAWRWLERDGMSRRIVPSPVPAEILELDAIVALLAAGIVPICAGGGGIAVTRGPTGKLDGLEAVVDKDLTTALLAERIEASAMLLVTDVEAVHADWGSGHARPLATLDREEASHLDLPDGSMGPKVEAALGFAERTGRPAVIGSLDGAAGLLTGERGTRVVARAT